MGYRIWHSLSGKWTTYVPEGGTQIHLTHGDRKYEVKSATVMADTVFMGFSVRRVLGKLYIVRLRRGRRRYILRRYSDGRWSIVRAKRGQREKRVAGGRRFNQEIGMECDLPTLIHRKFLWASIRYPDEWSWKTARAAGRAARTAGGAGGGQ